ncbi:alkaline phosphatase family protein [Flammeovirga yaeyamensis]|uniref:Alkaline phosphatase family protein n=1 Tax=Flammeovirga yaeyamensis TaxID=367791 RepID=A0AAX1N0C5_9BACT|nr:ectonucleotide pyrophosphatase/phosphodiesterase [Flammeovirga yaeyamensis]MBB3700111.1 putative AlkP superfamily pyrophosphatase or phosphodiesterase [Flammeovirga yaeyamensis]NMF37258.1 alkaline phosphatase family protein [Flammeovirga yaeyamensis]QWG00946.1 alkaline phosphatase family protein [Flammeovirga yaeyamensis]
MKNLIILATITFLMSCQTHKSNQKNNTVILVSLDGFRYDYPEIYDTPNLDEIAKNGVKSVSMIPAYPSKTFPNHYSLVTGMYPQNHGLVHNVFYDPDRDQKYHIGLEKKDATWCKGVPLWNLAEQQGIKSASYYWPTSDARIGGMQGSYFYKYNKSTPYIERVQQIENWLSYKEDVRPRFISLYFSLVDTQGHHYGPESEETKQAVEEVDTILGKLMGVINKADVPVDLIVVSDHGMIEVDKKNPIVIDDLGTFEEYEVVNAGGSQLFFYNKGNGDDEQLKKSLGKYKNDFKVYLKNEMPQKLHYSEGSRIPDVICEGIPPKAFAYKGKTVSKGMHGFDPYTNKEMHAVFYGVGSHFQKNKVIPSFENVHIYPLIADLLDLEIHHQIDGKLEVLKEAMKE